LFVVCETVMLSGSAIAWVAIHREHHKHSDTEKDPHSPVFKGYWRVHFMSMFVKPKIKHAVDLIRSPFYKFQHQYYFTINIVYALILFLLDPFAIIYAWLVPAALVWNAGSLIVSFSHKEGKATDNALLGLLTFGEGWHKTHHDNWRRKRLHSFDLGGILIQGIENVEKTFGTSSNQKT
jgi:stearoyl-CoA desaturase (delta-9 desaturase)